MGELHRPVVPVGLHAVADEGEHGDAAVLDLRVPRKPMVACSPLPHRLALERPSGSQKPTFGLSFCARASRSDMVSMRTSARGCRTGAVTGAKPMAVVDDTAS